MNQCWYLSPLHLPFSISLLFTLIVIKSPCVSVLYCLSLNDSSLMNKSKKPQNNNPGILVFLSHLKEYSRHIGSFYFGLLFLQHYFIICYQYMFVPHIYIPCGKLKHVHNTSQCLLSFIFPSSSPLHSSLDALHLLYTCLQCVMTSYIPVGS